MLLSSGWVSIHLQSGFEGTFETVFHKKKTDLFSINRVQEDSFSQKKEKGGQSP